MESVRVAVVGGSLGGLTTACLLRDSGHDVTIYERSKRALEQRGAGIGLLPETSRYLTERAGLELDSISTAADYTLYLDRSDAVVHRITKRYRFSSWNALYQRFMNHWGSDRYRLDHEMVDFVDDGGEVTVRFSNGSSVACDLLVCADGVGSTARSRLQPAAEPRYAGYVAWRGTVEEQSLDPDFAARFDNAITYHVGRNSHILVYPIPGIDGSVKQGERLINFVWYRNYEEGEPLADLMTDRDGERRTMSLPPGAVAAHHVAEVKASAAAELPPSIATIVARTAEPFVQVIYDLEVSAVAFNRVCLIGDAAYVVRPHAAAGTAKAADDAWKLDEALTGASSVEAALAAWAPGQLTLGADLLRRTRAIGHRSQVAGDWDPEDRELLFGLYGPGTA